MESIRDVLAENLRENRRKAGISQAKLAEMAEISTQYIAMIELSRQFPTPDVLERIAASFGIEAYELFSVAPSPESTMEVFDDPFFLEAYDRDNSTMDETRCYCRIKAVHTFGHL